MYLSLASGGRGTTRHMELQSSQRRKFNAVAWRAHPPCLPRPSTLIWSWRTAPLEGGGAVDDIPVWVYIVDLGAVPEVNWTEKYGSCFVANDLDG